MKKCTKCQIEKDESDFQKISKASDKLKSNCKSCTYAASITWNRSPKGVAIRTWHKQVARSKHRGHNPPTYTQQQLIEYMLNHEDFDRLYSEYVKSSYDRMKVPSVDRLDDLVGYTMDNIRLVSFEENMEHAYESGRNREHINRGWNNGKLKDHTPVVRLTLSGEYIDQFMSVSEACRKTGSIDSKISNACSGKRKSHNNCQWRYLTDYDPVKKYPDLTERKNKGQAKVVLKLGADGLVLGKYDSTSKAAQASGLSQSAISLSARQGVKSGGFNWVYEEDYGN